MPTPQDPLNELQLRFKSLLTQTGTPGLEWIRDRPPLSREQRLGIYSYAYLDRLTETLQEDFAVVYQFLGDPRFKSECAEYLARYPSTSVSVCDLGGHFAEFLSTRSVSSEFPYLGEIARLEWALIESFYAIEAPREGLEKIPTAGAAEWNSARFRLDASVRLLENRWSIAATVEDPKIAPIESPQCVLIHRGGDDAVFEIVGKADLDLLRHLSSGSTLQEACAGFSASEIDPDTFPEWVRDGVLHSILWEAN